MYSRILKTPNADTVNKRNTNKHCFKDTKLIGIVWSDGKV